MAAHILSFYAPSLPGWAIETLGHIGMSLFFTLSGFVIHYNYSYLGNFRLREYGTFMAIRFARLYPLFILLLTIDFSIQNYTNDSLRLSNLLVVAPYFLTLTQSWFYLPISGGHATLFGYSIGGISWSISTEWFFYVIYPVIAYGVVRLRTGRAIVTSAILITVGTLALLSYCGNSTQEITEAATWRFGHIAEDSPYSFTRWLFYLSPYARVFEFCLGCIVAQAVLTNQTETRLFRGQGACLIVPVLISIVGVQAYLLAYQVPSTQLWAQAFAISPLIAALLFLLSGNKQSFIARALSVSGILLVAEASYSIYLLHPLVLGFLMPPNGLAAVTPNVPIARALLTAVLVIMLSLAMARWFELPARIWLRKGIMDASVGGIRFRLALTCMGAPLVAAAFLIVRALPQQEPALIDYVYASYGTNQGVPANNILQDFAGMCRGKSDCLYIPDLQRTQDPAPGLGKDMTLNWRCGRETMQSIYVEAEATFKPPVHISCLKVAPSK